MTVYRILIFFNYFLYSEASYHWMVTETGRIEPKLDGAFPIQRSYDLPALLEQEKRVALLAEMTRKMRQFKSSVDKQWAAITLENDFEKKLYETDPNCVSSDEDPLLRPKFRPVFVDYPTKNRDRFFRPKLPEERINDPPPDCRKYHKLDFSLLTFPHLKLLRDAGNISSSIGHVQSVARLDIDIKTMLATNHSDWTAYNLGVRYWQLRGNGSNAFECARRAIFFAPLHNRHFAVFNLGTLLHAIGNYNEAAIVLHTAVDLDRSYYRSHVALGHVYLFLGDYARSVGCYENALSLKPDLTPLAKFRSSVLCYEQLITRLKALDVSLKKMVDDLKKYTKLQEQWVWTNTQIGVERACGVINTPSLDNLRTLWKKVEKQTMRLAERLTRAQSFLTEDGSTPSISKTADTETAYYVVEPVRKPDPVPEPKKMEEIKPPSKEPKLSNIKTRQLLEKMHLERVADFYTFMQVMSYRHDVSEERLKLMIIEKLVALQNNFQGEQPKGGTYWEIVRRCSNRNENDVLLFECGHKIFTDYIELVNDRDKRNPLPSRNIENLYDDFEEEPVELLDESGIENYVEENSKHDSSEL